MFAANEGVTPNDKLYVDDVFSTYLYTGNGSTQTITNGIDLAGKGGLVWLKKRSTTSTLADFDHFLQDTARGAGNTLSSNTTGASQANNILSSFNNNGFTVGLAGYNRTTDNFVSWTFRKQPKFFDVVTYTATGSVQTIPHNLGSVPGCIIVKSLSDTYDWGVYHRGLSNPNDQALILNSSNAAFSSTIFNKQAPTATEFYVNFTSGPYVAYLFAHNAGGFGLTGTDNVISCGSYTGTGASYGPQVDLGFEPQFVMIKAATTTGSWAMFDNMRGIQVSGPDQRLYADTSGAEATTGGNGIEINATGFRANETFAYINGSGQTYIYIAIRRPNKPPTTGTQVFSLASISTSALQEYTIDAGIPGDLFIREIRNIGAGKLFVSRLSGSNYLDSTSTGAEAELGGSGRGFNGQTTIKEYLASGWNVTYPVFRRAPGFFDVVCYTGNSVQGRTITHNLGVKPELMFVKSRSNAISWQVYSATETATKYMLLDSSQGSNTASFDWNNTEPTSSVFTVQGTGGTGLEVNWTGYTYVAYLFATCPGVSKVGSYTGTGTSQTINCGFTTGARFILIKRTDSTGDWYVWDSARGIVAANDPHLSLNTTATEVTTNDSVDPDSSGFIVNQNTATNINVSGASYIFLAIA